MVASPPAKREPAMTDFWRNWLTILCGAIGAFGLVLIGTGFTATSGPGLAVLRLMNPAATLDFDPTLRFGFGLLGAVTLGWSVTLLAAFRAADRLGAAGAPVWRLLTGGLIGWYLIDSTISIATGFTLNAVSNTLFLAAFLLPAWRAGVLGGGTGRVAGRAV